MPLEIWRVQRARRCRIIALAAVLCLGAVLPCLGADLSVEVASDLVFPDEKVLLRDLARIVCPDPDLLYKASIAPVGFGEVLVPKDITSALSNAKIGGVSLNLIMADQVPYRFQSRLERIVKDSSGWKGLLVAQTERPVPEDWEIIPPDRLYPGMESVNLRVLDKSEEKLIPLRLYWYIPAVVSRNPIRRGDPISQEDLAIDLVPYERNRRYFSDPRLLVGMKAAKDVAKGQAFTVRTTDEVQMVSSGDKVRIIYKKGSLTVWAPGRALASGALGDKIKVRNNRTKSVVLGVIVGPGAVEVSE